MSLILHKLLNYAIANIAIQGLTELPGGMPVT